MTDHAPKTRCQKTMRGYSLIEIAIALSVVGIVLGALWEAAESAWEYARREQMREIMATTVANTRSYFSGQAGIPNMTYDNLTNLLLTVNVIPGSIKRQAACSSLLCADNLWGSYSGGALDANGTFRVCNWSLGASGCGTAPTGISPFFGISLTGLRKKYCTALAQTMSSAVEPTGLVEINLNGTNLLASGKPIQPTTDTDVINLCNPASGTEGTSVATFIYRVVAPSP